MNDQFTELDRDLLHAVLVETFDHAREPAMVVIDSQHPDCPVVYANNSLLSLLGRDRDGVIGTPVNQLRPRASAGARLPEDLRDRTSVAADIAVPGGMTAQLRLDAVDRTDGRYWVGRVDTSGIAAGESGYDPLTGQPNQSLFEDRLRQAIAYGRRINATLAVVSLSLDGFPELVSRRGQAVADSVLCGVAIRLTVAFRESDTIARLGESSFGLIMPVAHTSDSARIAQKARELIAEPFRFDSGDAVVTASIGIAVMPSDGEDAGRLVRQANQAAQDAEADGGDRYRFAAADLNEAVRDQIKREIQMRWALEEDAFRVHYQPLFHPETNALAEIEALIRWEHPDIGLVPPGDFLPIAEQSGLIVAIGEWVLHRACGQNKNWQNDGRAAVPIAVNLSTLELRRPGLVTVVEGILKETGLAAEHLCLEMSVKAIRNQPDFDKLVDKLKALKKVGVRLSIDHFGTGDLPLGLLQRLPIDRLTIDRSFLGDFTSSSERTRVVRAAIALAQSLGVKVVAQGIESETVRDFLRDEKTDAVQGFLLGMPMPAEEFQGRFLDAAVARG